MQVSGSLAVRTKLSGVSCSLHDLCCGLNLNSTSDMGLSLCVSRFYGLYIYMRTQHTNISATKKAHVGCNIMYVFLPIIRGN